MGRHSRRGPAQPGAAADITAGADGAGTPQASRPQGPGGGTPGPGRRRRAPGADGTPAHGTPAYGTPPNGTPVQGTPARGTPAHGIPRVRGGHPEQREPGGGWGAGPATGPTARPRPESRIPGPRREYVEAFDDEDLFTPRTGARPEGPATPTGAAPGSAAAPPKDPYASVTAWEPEEEAAGEAGTAPIPAQRRRGKGLAFTGIAAAAVTTVLAVVVAGQVTGGKPDGDVQGKAAGTDSREGDGSSSRSHDRAVPAHNGKAAPATYTQLMDRIFPLDAKLKGSGRFEVVPGFAKAPGKGRLFRYRVDIEKGLGLDGALFAEAVQKTLNDNRSWAHEGGRTFERVSSGKADFVITLASPGTTAVWCAKSGLDTAEDNVSCDSAATDRVMINAYRWAQGSKTYGDPRIHPYRQMLINHEVGHRLGFNHVTCHKDGELAPVMQQQTKFLDHDGIHCKPNPWPFPTA
ncbi:DUF3152 domain-containing protein [Streptomyces sp. NPDC002004]